MRESVIVIDKAVKKDLTEKIFKEILEGSEGRNHVASSGKSIPDREKAINVQAPCGCIQEHPGNSKEAVWLQWSDVGKSSSN